MDGAKKAVVNDLAAAMEKAGIAGAQTADQVIATGDYKQIPKSRRYGMMAGMVVHKEIADDILGAQNIVTADDSLLDQVIGNGGKLDKFVNYWKWSKVAANPPAWARNMISNMILLNLSGVPLVRMPDLVFSQRSGTSLTRVNITRLRRTRGLSPGICPVQNLAGLSVSSTT